MGSQPKILEAFREAATQGDSVVARRDGDRVEVRAVGRTGDGRDVAWIVRPARDAGTAGIFMEGLRQFYGEPIGREVSRQLGLRESNDSLEARSILGALEMASASQQAFAGLNFISRHAVSARRLTPQFRLVCVAAGVLPERIPDAKRLKADEIFQERFARRCDGDRRSVDLVEARLMMAEVLSEIMAME